MRYFIQLHIAFAVSTTLVFGRVQQADTSWASDSLITPLSFWTGRLVTLPQDYTKPFLLYLPWDEWGHSDLISSTANPFVPTDCRLGAVFLDGSLGVPVFSYIIPSAAIVNHDSPDLPAFLPAPLGDASRRSQTYFFWDQGDYQYQDVQIGGVAQLDPIRNIMTAGHTRSHPGRYALAGPSRSQFRGNVLQNYLVDYGHRITPTSRLNYTLLHQREQVGLPVLEGGILTADRRYSRTWAQGFHVNSGTERVNTHFYLATSVNHVRTTTDGAAEAYLNRRSLSVWGGGNLQYQWKPRSKLLVDWESKYRFVSDKSLGYLRQDRTITRIGTRWDKRPVAVYGGISIGNGRIAPEGNLLLGTDQRHIALYTELTSFFDYLHYGRRITLDETVWLPGPVFLRRTGLAIQTNGNRIRAGARLIQLSTSDDRNAIAAGLVLSWIPWINVLRLYGSLSAVNSPDSILFPPRIHSQAGFTFTLPLRRVRARPFVSAHISYLANEFATWVDPRFTDITPFDNPVGGTSSSTLWINLEGGLKVADFELRFRVDNALGSTIQNSPYYLPQPGLGDIPLKHYSLTWRFPPQKK